MITGILGEVEIAITEETGGMIVEGITDVEDIKHHKQTIGYKAG